MKCVSIVKYYLTIIKKRIKVIRLKLKMMIYWNYVLEYGLSLMNMTNKMHRLNQSVS